MNCICARTTEILSSNTKGWKLIQIITSLFQLSTQNKIKILYLQQRSDKYKIFTAKGSTFSSHKIRPG